MEETVLCYIKKEHQYLMLLRNKKKHDLNNAKWIGVGGHIEIGETKEEALLREVNEETGLTLLSYQYHGKVIFKNDDYQEVMYLYTSDSFTGELINCDEGELQWIDIDKVLSLNIWEGDKEFLKLLIDNEKDFILALTYHGDKLINTEIKRL